MIGRERESEILRLYHAEKWKVGTIARQLGLHHTTVRRVLAQAGVDAGRSFERRSKLEPFLPFIRETLEQYPSLPSSRLYQMAVERGYRGAADYFRSVVARYRPKKKHEAFLRLSTLPGEEAQVDWAHFGKIAVGSAQRALWAFVMVLSFSRRLFLRFYLSAKMECFLDGHVRAFEAFGGVARRSLYDNLKSVVLERAGSVVRFNQTFLDFAAHYRFAPVPVGIRRGNEKACASYCTSFVHCVPGLA
jgi:transposase